MAVTQVDLIGHSLGGVVSRRLLGRPAYKDSDNFYRGKVRKFVSLAAPQAGTQIANMIVNLHDEFVDPQTGAHSEEISNLEWVIETGTGWPIGPGPGGNFHQGAMCDLAENSVALNFPEVTAVKTYAMTASKGEIGQFDGDNRRIPLFFSDQNAAHTTPYVFDHVNDTQVALDSQVLLGGLPYTNNPLLDHGQIKNDQATADLVFLQLDRDGIGAAPVMMDGMPGNVSDGSGIPRAGVGREWDPINNENYDAANYRRQCGPGGWMNQL